MGQCTFTFKDRIERHDKVVNFIATEVWKEDNTAKIAEEPRLRHMGATWK